MNLITPPGVGEGPERPRRIPRAVRGGIALTETAVYVTVGAFLVAAAVLTVIGTGSALVDAVAGDASAIRSGLRVLDRILLVFIVAELLFTVRLILAGGQLPVEPFLAIGLIAVVRRVLIVTAEFERRTGAELTNFLLELVALALLAVALAAAIVLVRRSRPGADDGTTR